MTRRRRLLEDSHVVQVATAKGRNMWGPVDIAIRRRVVAAGPYLTSSPGCQLCHGAEKVERFSDGPTGEWVACPCTRKESR